MRQGNIFSYVANVLARLLTSVIVELLPMLFMESNANKANQNSSNENSSNKGSTVRCNNCGSLFPKDYEKCPKCKTLK